MQRKVNTPRKGEVNVTEIISRLHSAKFTLLRPEKVNEIVNRVREAKGAEDAIYAALEVHETPLTFNDIKSLMRENHKHPERITRALEELIRQRKAQKVIVITPEDCVTAYATITDTQILVGIPVRLLRELGYGVWVGSANEGQREPYDLDLVEDDWLMIHIDRIGGQSSEGPSRKGAQEA
jgi:transcription initiation factor TFIIIB Brf1 subunit/transcription initiation factor TFIIB